MSAPRYDVTELRFNLGWAGFYHTSSIDIGMFSRSESASSFQVNLLANIVNGNVTTCAQFAFLTNFVKKDMVGAQIGGINQIKNDLYGSQTGIINTVNNKADGVQIGVINVAKKNMFGFQIELINYSEELEGFQFGLFNMNRNGFSFPFPIINFGFGN